MAQPEMSQADIDRGYYSAEARDAWAAGAAEEARHSATMLTVALFFTGGTLWGLALGRLAEALWAVLR